MPRLAIKDLPHEFEDEIRLLVTENHRITMRGIQQSEDELVDHLRKQLAQEDEEVIGSEVSRARSYFGDLRRAANHMALVSLVTRLEHWTRKFVKQTLAQHEPQREQEETVVRAMEALNTRLGRAPVDVQFFKDLVTAPNAVIHHDSRAEWKFNGKLRRVAARYTDCGDLDFTDEHLREATEKVTTQVKWYDEHIATLQQSSKK